MLDFWVWEWPWLVVGKGWKKKKKKNKNKIIFRLNPGENNWKCIPGKSHMPLTKFSKILLDSPSFLYIQPTFFTTSLSIGRSYFRYLYAIYTIQDTWSCCLRATNSFTTSLPNNGTTLIQFNTLHVTFFFLSFFKEH